MFAPDPDRKGIPVIPRPGLLLVSFFIPNGLFLAILNIILIRLETLLLMYY